MIEIDVNESRAMNEICKEFNLSFVDGWLYNSTIDNRVYVVFKEEKVYISNDIKSILEEQKEAVDSHSKEFYLKFGFILPPFTIYENVFVLAPYLGFDMTMLGDYKVLYPNKKLNKPIEGLEVLNERIRIDLLKSFAENRQPMDVLFSAGIDSSVLLALAKQSGIVNSAINCHMSSMSGESVKAKKMCYESGIQFDEVILRNDLEESAINFVQESGEVISDSIAVVMPELLVQSKVSKNACILDGQGADSLFSGLPHDKVYELYRKKWLRLFFKVVPKTPVWKSKKTKYGRLMYRITKVFNCLSSSSPIEMLLDTLVEDPSVKISTSNRVYCRFVGELNELSEELKDFHLVIRYLFMFRILHAREMQKYIVAKKRGYIFHLPFIEKAFVEKYFYVNSSSSIVDNVFKYPMVELAKELWPGLFNTSNTSPFQVEFSVGERGVKSLSLMLLNKN